MMRAAETIELYDQHLLAEVIEGTDVRGVLGGHLHFLSYSCSLVCPSGGVVHLLRGRPGNRRSLVSEVTGTSR